MKYVLLVLALVVSNVMLNSCKHEKTNDDKIIEFAVNDLQKNVFVPSSFVVDSTRVLSELFPDKNIIGENKTVVIYYQAQNRLGALLRGYTRYNINIDTSGALSIRYIKSYDNEKEYEQGIINEQMKRFKK